MVTTVVHDAERESGLEAARSALRKGQGVAVLADPGWGRTQFLRTLIESLSAEDRATLWIGDDVDRYDSDRVARLIDAIKARTVIPLMTMRRRGFDAAFDRLCRDGVIERIDLSPLGGTAVLRIVESILDGPLDASAVPILIPRRAGGDLVILSEVVREARSSGVLQLVSGQWRFTDVVQSSDGARRLVLDRIGESSRVTPIAETIIDVVALAPELRLDHVIRIVDDLCRTESRLELERLEAEAIIDAREGSGGLRIRIRVHDPVIELMVPQTVGQLRRRRIIEAIVDALAAEPVAELEEHELITLARLSLLVQRPVDPMALTQAAESALRASRTELALQLAAVSLSHGGGVDAELVLASAESQLGRSEEALVRLERLQFDTDAEPRQRGARDELVRLMNARLADPASNWNLASNSAAQAEVIDLASTLRMSAISTISADPGHPRHAVTDQAAVLEGERLALAGTVATLSGRQSEAEELLAEARSLLEANGVDTFRVRWGQMLSQIYDQSTKRSMDSALALRDEAAALGQGGQQGMCEWLAGAIMVTGGQATAATTIYRHGLDLLEANGLEETAAFARAGLATALATCGDAQSAREVLAPMATLSPGQPFLAGWCLQALGWIHAADGQLEDAAAAFLDAAGAHARDGYNLLSVVALVESARSGNALRVLPQIEELADVVEGCCIAVAVRFGQALAAFERVADNLGSASDLADEFDSIGQASADLGLSVYAAEAFSAALNLHRLSGQEREASASARQMTEQLARCDMAWLPLLKDHATVTLSGREIEIAEFVAAGLSNREVAEQLVLSVRTVETHLQRIYRKLGVRARSELADALIAPVKRQA